MQYSVSEISNGVAKITWSDESWSFIELDENMTEAEFDQAVFNMAPPYLKTGGTAPSFLSAGATRTAALDTNPSTNDDRPAWLKARAEAYGDVYQQIEYITENGLDAWQTKVVQIKTDNPKS